MFFVASLNTPVCPNVRLCFRFFSGAGAGSAAAAPASEFVGDHQAREVQQEEREAMVGVDEESDMWSP